MKVDLKRELGGEDFCCLTVPNIKMDTVGLQTTLSFRVVRDNLAGVLLEPNL